MRQFDLVSRSPTFGTSIENQKKLYDLPHSLKLLQSMHWWSVVRGMTRFIVNLLKWYHEAIPVKHVYNISEKIFVLRRYRLLISYRVRLNTSKKMHQNTNSSGVYTFALQYGKRATLDQAWNAINSLERHLIDWTCLCSAVSKWHSGSTWDYIPNPLQSKVVKIWKQGANVFSSEIQQARTSIQLLTQLHNVCTLHVAMA